MQFYYLLVLIFSLSGLLYADYSHKLAFFRHPKITLRLMAAGLVFFLGWDLAGLVFGVFSTNQAWVSGLHVITENLPIEEFFFLCLLCYTTILTWRLACLRIS